MDEPTDKQVKEFWEWCGWKEWETGSWWYLGENASDGLPPIDLNNLFKYAVPTLQRNGYLFTLCPTRFTGKFEVDIWRSGDIGITSSVDKDPAMALFWALWEVTNG